MSSLTWSVQRVVSFTIFTSITGRTMRPPTDLEAGRPVGLPGFRQIEQGAMRYPKLVDFREAEPDFSERDIRLVVAAYEPRGPLAVVVIPANEEVVRRALHLGQGARPAVICYDIPAALEWLTTGHRSKATPGVGKPGRPQAAP